MPSVDDPTDLSALLSVGPLNMDPGQQTRVTFLLAYGDNVADFLANIRAAGASGNSTTAVGEPQLPASLLALGQNVPNPFNPVTTIDFGMPRTGDVNLSVYDLSGRLVRTLVAGQVAAGQHLARWDGRDDQGAQAASGIYLYRLTTPEGALSRKMMLVK